MLQHCSYTSKICAEIFDNFKKDSFPGSKQFSLTRSIKLSCHYHVRNICFFLIACEKHMIFLNRISFNSFNAIRKACISYMLKRYVTIL